MPLLSEETQPAHGQSIPSGGNVLRDSAFLEMCDRIRGPRLAVREGAGLRRLELPAALERAAHAAQHYTAEELEPQVNWRYLEHCAREKARLCLSADQTLCLSHAMDRWGDMAAELATCASEAEAEISNVIKQVSAQRREWMAFSGRVIWLVLTVSVPPPAGALVGTVVRGLLSERTWVGAVRVSTEWSLQAPFPHGKAGRVDLGAPNFGPGKDTRSARLDYIGGHTSLRELKDSHHVLGGVEDIFAGTQRKLVDELNKTTLQSLVELGGPSEADGKNLRNVIQRECSRKSEGIWRGIKRLIEDITSTPDGARNIVLASWHYQRADILRRLNAPNNRLEPATYVKDTVQQGVDLFINTLVYRTLAGVVDVIDARYVPDLDRQAVRKSFERLLLAHYLAAHTTRPSGGGGVRNIYRDPDFFAETVGTVDASLVQLGGLTEKLTELGIVAKHEAPPFAVRSRLRAPSTAQQATEQQFVFDMFRWMPPENTSEWRPVPYQSWDANARGRLAAWAEGYVALPLNRSLRELLHQFALAE